MTHVPSESEPLAPAHLSRWQVMVAQLTGRGIDRESIGFVGTQRTMRLSDDSDDEADIKRF